MEREVRIKGEGNEMDMARYCQISACHTNALCSAMHLSGISSYPLPVILLETSSVGTRQWQEGYALSK